MSEQKIPNINTDFDLRLMLLITRRSLIWVMLIMALGVAGGYLYLRYMLPVYETATTLKIGTEDNANKILNIKSTYADEENSNNNIAGATELIRSNVILQKVVNSLPLQIDYYNKGRVLNFEMYKTSPINVTAYLKNSDYYGQAFFVTTNANGLIQLSVNKMPIGTWTPLGQWIVTSIGSFKVELKDTANGIKEVKEDKLFFVVNDPALLAHQYAKKVTVSLLNSQAQTISITVKENHPEKAADLANGIAQAYLKYDLQKMQSGADSTLAFIDKRLSTVDVDLRSSEIDLENFKRSNKLFKSTDNVSGTLTAVNELQADKLKYDIDIETLVNIQKNIAQNKDINSLLALLGQNTGMASIVTLASNIQGLEADKERLTQQATQQNDLIKNLNNKIDARKKTLLESIDLAKRAAEENRKIIVSKISDEDKELSSIPNKEAEYTRLERLFNIHEKFYSLLLEKKAEFLITKAGLVSNNLVLEEATTPILPIYPLRLNVYLYAFSIGLLLSSLLIVIRYVFHNDITSPDDIKPYIKNPILGIVPLYKEDIPVSELIVDKNPKSSISEAFRSIRTNLQFISNEPGFKLITVTSTISGEGKTFVAINLGGVMAFSGKKVIVLDLDMRKPKIHLGFGAANDKGISTILIGKDHVENCIRKSNLENLDYITAGPIPPNPAELILSQKMEGMLHELRNTYDIIIIDTPPVGIVTDGVPLLQRADYPIYVVRSQYSKKGFINSIAALSTENHINKLSIILNGFETHSKFGYGYGYGYGNYGYGYGGYYEEAAKGPSLFSKILNKKK